MCKLLCLPQDMLAAMGLLYLNTKQTLSFGYVSKMCQSAFCYLNAYDHPPISVLLFVMTFSIFQTVVHLK